MKTLMEPRPTKLRVVDLTLNKYAVEPRFNIQYYVRKIKNNIEKSDENDSKFIRKII